MDQIFDKEERERIHAMIGNGMYPNSLCGYIEALEEIAEAAATVWKDGYVLSSSQEAALYSSLNQVDWMRE